MRRSRFFLGVGLFLALAGIASAQESRGRVQGVVTDPSNTVVVNAKVILKNDATGVQNTRMTSSQGSYLFDYVDSGTYTITAELAGFRTTVQKNVIVRQRGDVTANMALLVGELTDTVTVTESPVQVQFTTASRDLTIEQQMVRELPVITRNPFGLAALDPSVTNRGSMVETQPYHNRTANEQDIGGE
jgi:hypothetical protein